MKTIKLKSISKKKSLKHILPLLQIIKAIYKTNDIYKNSGSVKQINIKVFYKAIHAILTNTQLSKKEIKTYLKARKDFECFKTTTHKFISKKYTLPLPTELKILGLPKRSLNEDY